MSTRRRIAFAAGLVLLAVASGAATLAASTAVRSDEPQPRAAVAAIQKTVAAPTPRSPQAAVVGFLSALRNGDYARACDTLLDASGCEDGLAARNAGVSAFQVVDTRVRGSEAVVDAIADGVSARFTLLERSSRWWIATLDLA